MKVCGSLDSEINFSILIPSYNDNDGLLKTLDSLKGEIYSNVVIVDDGSKYPVVDFLSNIKTYHNIVVLELHQNSGIIVALNSGIDFLHKNKIRYVYRLDSCDINCTGRLALQMEKMISTGAMMVGGQVEYFDEKSNFILKLPTEYHNIKNMQFYRSCFIHPAVLLDLHQICCENPYRKKFRHAEDYDLFLRIVRNGLAVNIDQIVVKCFVRANGLSLSNRRAQIISVLKSQIDNRSLFNIYFYIGVFKTLLMLIAPLSFVNSIKKLFLFKC